MNFIIKLIEKIRGKKSEHKRWKAGEPGPTCFCGLPTSVAFIEVAPNKSLPILMCLFHQKGFGAEFTLPSERPENWPNLSHEEMKKLVEKGEAEHDSAEE